MSELLSSVSWDDLLLVGTAMGLLGGVQWVREKRNGTGDVFSRELCEERHNAIASKLNDIKTNVTESARKLDRLIEHFLEKQ